MAIQMMDVCLDDAEDLDITSNDIAVVESTAQHQRQLILNNKGDFKENPTLCVGAFNYLDDENFGDLIREISIEFTKDGMDVQSIKVGGDGKIVSDAYYR